MCIYAFQNTFLVLHDLIVPVTQNVETTLFQIAGPLHVISGLITVLRAIEFDNETCFVTEEVNDVRTYRHLPAEFEIMNTAITQVSPEAYFCRSLVLSQAAGSIN